MDSLWLLEAETCGYILLNVHVIKLCWVELYHSSINHYTTIHFIGYLPTSYGFQVYAYVYMLCTLDTDLFYSLLPHVCLPYVMGRPEIAAPYEINFKELLL